MINKLPKMLDNRTPWDPFNFLKEARDSNISNIHYVDEACFKYFIQFEKCLTCKMEKEEKIPVCLHPDFCRFKMHAQKSRDKQTGEFEGGFSIETRNGNSNLNVFFSRPLLVINYVLFLNGYRIIFRPGYSGFHIHHINKNHFDDSISNLSVFRSDEHHLFFHSKKHKKEIRDKRKELLQLYYEYSTVVEKGPRRKEMMKRWKDRNISIDQVSKELAVKLTEFNKLMSLNFNERFSQSAIKEFNTIQEFCDKNILYEPQWTHIKYAQWSKEFTIVKNMKKFEKSEELIYVSEQD